MVNYEGTQREWIIPCNLKFYDIAESLKNLKIIDWKQTLQMKNARVGDLVYMYCKPTKGAGWICFKGAILEVNKTESLIDDSKYAVDGEKPVGPCFSMAMFREYDLSEELTYEQLKQHGLKSRLQGPTVVSGSVAEYLHYCDDLQRASDRFMGSIPDTCLFDFPIAVNEILSDHAKSVKKKKECQEVIVYPKGTKVKENPDGTITVIPPKRK